MVTRDACQHTCMGVLGGAPIKNRRLLVMHASKPAASKWRSWHWSARNTCRWGCLSASLSSMAGMHAAGICTTESEINHSVPLLLACKGDHLAHAFSVAIIAYMSTVRSIAVTCKRSHQHTLGSDSIIFREEEVYTFLNSRAASSSLTSAGG